MNAWSPWHFCSIRRNVVVVLNIKIFYQLVMQGHLLRLSYQRVTALFFCPPVGLIVVTVRRVDHSRVKLLECFETANSTYLSCVCMRVSFFSHSTQLSNAHGSICCIHCIFFLVFQLFRSVTYTCTASNVFWESYLRNKPLDFCLSIIWWFTPWVRIHKKKHCFIARWTCPLLLCPLV